MKLNDTVTFNGCDWTIKDMSDNNMTLQSLNGKFKTIVEKKSFQYVKSGFYQTTRRKKDVLQ